MHSFAHRSRFALLIGLAVLIASACAPTRTGTAWPSLSNVTTQSGSHVMVTYNNWAVLLEPSTGTVVQLLDSEGAVRTDDQGKPRRWEIDGNTLSSTNFYSAPAIRTVDGVEQMVLPTHTSKLVLVDIETARVENPTGVVMSGNIVANMAEDETSYYVPFDNHDVASLDKTSLSVNWRFVTNAGVWSTPVLNDGILYFTTIDHKVYAVNASDGTQVWDAPADTGGLIGGSPLVADGFLYVGNTLDNLYKLDAATGEIITQAKLRGWSWSTPVLLDAVLYATDLNGWVYALNPDDLSVIWETQAAQKGIRPAPLLTDAHVVVATRDGHVIWLDRQTGAIVYNVMIEGNPEVLGDLLYVPADDAAGVIEPMILVSSLNLSHLVNAYTAGTATQRWVYAR